MQGSLWSLVPTVLPPDNGLILLVHKPRNPYFLPLVESTVVGLPHPFGKLLQWEFGLLQADWGFAFCTAKVRRIFALIRCILLVVEYILQTVQVHNPCDMCFSPFCWQLESFCREAYEVSPRCPGRVLRWRTRSGRCWPNDWMMSWRSWRHFRCTWRWRPLSWEPRSREHLRPAVTIVVQVITFPWWPLTWKSLACAAGRLRNMCHAEWRLVIILRSAW